MTAKPTQTVDNVSMEAIAFQDNKFGLALEAVFEKVLVNKLSAQDLDEQFAPEFNAIIKQFTNLPIQVNFKTTFIEKVTVGGPAIYIDTFTPRHIFNDKNTREGMSDLGEKNIVKMLETIKQNNLKNTIDLKRAWVTGIFAEVPIRMIFPQSFVYGRKLTVKELTAVMLHEIGHAFTVCEYANRVNTTNQVLAGLMRSSIEDAPSVQEIVFKQAGELLFYDEKTFVVAEEITDTQAKFVVILNAVEKRSKSENSTTHYDFVSCEQQADQFAARMGYGRYIVTGLDKAFDNPLDKNAIARHYVGFCEVMFPLIKRGITVMSMVALGPQVYLLAATLTVFLFGLMMYQAGELNRNHTYDSTRVRYLRVREDILTRIKDKKIAPEMVKELLEDIAAIDKVLDGLLKTETKKYLEIASNYIFKKHRDAHDARQLQRQLEELASNDLYRVAAKLRTV